MSDEEGEKGNYLQKSGKSSVGITMKVPLASVLKDRVPSETIYVVETRITADDTLFREDL